MARTERQAGATGAQPERLIHGLKGERFLRADFAYGDELRLHFGEPKPYESAALAGGTRGSWVLGLRATPWMLVADGVILSRSHDQQQHALRHFSDLQGQSLDDVRLRRADVALTLRFGPDAWFMALTEPRRRAGRTLDLWELVTPDGVFVRAAADGGLAMVGPETSIPSDGISGRA